MLYIILLFVLGTIGTATLMRRAELAWIDYRGFPGVPDPYGGSYSTDTWQTSNVLCSVAFTLSTWMVDAFMASPPTLVSLRGLIT